MPSADRARAAPPRRLDRESRQARRVESRRRLLRRRLLVSSLLVVAVLATTAYLLDWLAGVGNDESLQPAPTVSPPAPTPVRPTSPPPPPPTEPPPVLSSPGDFPAAGPGTFQFGNDQGEVLGQAGALRRFRIAIEQGIDEEIAEFGEFIDTTLGDERGWTAGGDLRFQRVPDGAAHDFTIYLATGETTGRLCATGGLDVLAPSLPAGGVSCRVAGQVVLNLNRWRLSVEHYVDDEVPLMIYRQMVLNHEVGHELGYDHVWCPGQGDPAPVMQQQTLFLDGCEANPWPYVDGRRHTGPPVT